MIENLDIDSLSAQLNADPLIERYDLELSASSEIAEAAKIFSVDRIKDGYAAYVDENGDRWEFVQDYNVSRNTGSGIRMYQVEGDQERQRYHFQRNCSRHMLLTFDKSGNLIRVMDVDALKMREDNVVGFHSNYYVDLYLQQNPLIPKATRNSLEAFIVNYNKALQKDN